MADDPDPSGGRRPQLRLGLLVVVALVLAAGGLLAWQARQAERGGQAVARDLAAFRERLLDRDLEGARTALRSAQEGSRAARDAVDGPLWGAATVLPLVGEDVAAARDLTVVVDDVTQGALPAVLAALSVADPSSIGLQDGRIELGPLRQASGELDRADDQLRAADRAASGISTDGVSRAIASRVDEVRRQLERTSRLSTTAALAGRLLPDMLGGSEPRNYLVLAQNNAELRSLGGLVGAMVQLRVDDGRVELVRQAVPADLGAFSSPVLPLTQGERALFGDVLGRFPGNVTNAPSFPRAAELITAMWDRRIGGRLDGVAAVDPWALQLLVGALGPVDTSADQLTGDNTARTLLVDVYDRFEDPEQQNAVFAQAARAVFDAVRVGRADPRALTEALADGVEQGRVMLWPVREREQEILSRTALGRTIEDRTPASPELGVYLQDLTQSKMDVYQDVRIDVVPARCPVTDRVDVEVSLRSTAPLDRDLPLSVTGGGSRVAAGDIATRVAIYAPPGWTFGPITDSDGEGGLTFVEDGDRIAGFRDVVLTPGTLDRLQVALVANGAVPATWTVRYTPGAYPATVQSDVAGCSGATSATPAPP